MINPFEIMETINMVDNEHLDIRTITMGISLKSCAGPDIDVVCEKVYNKITTYAKDLVKTGEDIEAQFGIPIINKRISVTPVATLVDALDNPTVEKAVKMANMMNIPIIGIVENLSYFECPTCKEKIKVFGDSKIEEIAKKYNINNVAKIPIRPELAGQVDKGLVELFEGDFLDELSEKI